MNITTTMLSLISTSKAQIKLAENLRERRLSMDLTQEGLAVRTGVPLATLRKFEQKGTISLESFLKLLMVLGGLDEIVQLLKQPEPEFKSIDEVIKANNKILKKRGHRK